MLLATLGGAPSDRINRPDFTGQLSPRLSFERPGGPVKKTPIISAIIDAVWTPTDGVASALGSFGARRRSPTPSDHRLKRDVEPAAILSNGLKLDRYRYLADDRNQMIDARAIAVPQAAPH